MKKLLASIGLCLLCTGLFAQNTDITPPTSPPSGASLPGQVLGYFTSFNTNLDSTFAANRFDLWAGASSIQGAAVPLVNDIGVSFDVWRPSLLGTNSKTSLALAPEAVIRNGGVAGSLVSLQGGVGVSAIIHDVKATLYLDGGGYLDDKDNPQAFDQRLYGEIGLRVKKAFGQHFYGGVGLGAQFPDSAQVFSAFAGATF
jgi:hypothetical protein